MTDHAALRLSAQRAFLGRIIPSMRLISVKCVKDTIIVTCYVSSEGAEAVRELVSLASAEIISDFPSLIIDERIIVGDSPLPKGDVLINGWIYQRLEPPVQG